MLLDDELDPTESNTSNTQVTANDWDDNPLGSSELVNDDCDLDFTTKNTDPLKDDGDRKPNSYCRGSDSDDQADAANTNESFSSTPTRGCTENTPGIGGPPVLIVTELNEVAAWFAVTAVRVKVRVDLAGSLFAATRMFVTTLPPPAGITLTGLTNDAVLRSTAAELTFHIAVPPPTALTVPVSSRFAFTFTVCDAANTELMTTDGADSATTTTDTEALLDLLPTLIVTLTVDVLPLELAGADSHLEDTSGCTELGLHCNTQLLRKDGEIWLQLHANTAPALPNPFWSSS